MKRVFQLVVILVILIGISACNGGVVGFDTDTNENMITSGTNISNIYQPYGSYLGVNYSGVTFGCFPVQTLTNQCAHNNDNKVGMGDTYAVRFLNLPLPPSIPNVFAIGDPTHFDGSFNDTNGVGQATFWPIANQVSIWAYPVFGGIINLPFGNKIYLDAFDANNNFIGEANWIPQEGDLNTWHQLIYTSPQANISYVKFGTNYSTNTNYVQIFAYFDEFCWESMSFMGIDCTGQ